jgi:hypothetical protein
MLIFLGKCVKTFQCLGGVHHRRTTPHLDGHTQTVRDLLSGCATFNQRVHVQGDARLAAGCDGNPQSHEFFGFEIQRTILFDGFAQGAKAFGYVWDGFVQVA